MDRRYFVYIMANRPKGAHYVGRTSDLVKRVWEHRTGEIDGHTQRYRINQLVYYVVFDDIEGAARREHQLKRYRRGWKFNLIEQGNAGWKDLWFEIISVTNPYIERQSIPERCPGQSRKTLSPPPGSPSYFTRSQNQQGRRSQTVWMFVVGMGKRASRRDRPNAPDRQKSR